MPYHYTYNLALMQFIIDTGDRFCSTLLYLAGLCKAATRDLKREMLDVHPACHPSHSIQPLTPVYAATQVLPE